jgi:hypothetical protein
MKSKSIVILTNETGRDKVMGETTISLTLEETMNNLKVIIISDNCNLNNLKKKCAVAPDFLALHLTGMSQKGDTDLDLEDDYFNDCIYEYFGHNDTEDNFYKIILPKAYSRELTLKDIEEAFKTKLDKALNDLCDTWATIDFTDKEAMQTLATDRINKLNSIV